MPKVVKFTKSACPHCDIFDPIFKKTIEKERFSKNLEFFEVSLDDAPHMSQIFNIRGVPALYTFESDDFKDFENIQQLTIGHSHESYPKLEESLEELIESV